MADAGAASGAASALNAVSGVAPASAGAGAAAGARGPACTITISDGTIPRQRPLLFIHGAPRSSLHTDLSLFFTHRSIALLYTQIYRSSLYTEPLG